MKRKLESLLILAASSFAPHAFAQHIIGGGDPLMMMFAEARYEGALVLENLQPDALQGRAAPFGAWLGQEVSYRGRTLPRHQAMAAEMRRSTHAWKDGDLGLNKCAAVPLDPAAEPEVQLSLPRCRAMLAASPSGGAEALKTLIHEMGHRVGLSASDADEDFASSMAVVVFNAWRAARQGGVPFWTGTGDVLAPRYLPTAVWTGAGTGPVSNRLLIWGGCDESQLPGSPNCAEYLNTGARLVYKKPGPLGAPPETSWEAMSTEGAPVGRKLHTVVWTGEAKLAEARDKMIVFGGCRGEGTSCDQGLGVTPNSLYDARNDEWLPLSAASAPSPRVLHSAVWTSQDEMIVWGGLENYDRWNDDRILGDGAVLAFRAGKPEGEWRPLPATGAPAARYGHVGIWTGTRLLIFGGCGQEPGITRRCVKPLNDGAFLNPYPEVGEPYWTPLAGDAQVAPRTDFSAIWTGRYLIVWGGVDAGGRVLANGARYDVVEKSWRPLNPTLPRDANGPETGRRNHVAAFEPMQGRMVIWGGVAPDGSYPARTLIYDIANDRWSFAGTETDPVGREGHVAAWIQDSLFVWGGYHRDHGFLAQGGIFNP